MLHVSPVKLPDHPQFGPLALADHLIGLAQEADRSGMHEMGVQLVRFAYSLFDQASAELA